jgi:arginine N-succinyltransferase
MFILRNVEAYDLADLYELSGKVFFINLPHDQKIIKEKIDSSIACFKQPSSKLDKNYYIFVIEDLNTKKVVGVSMIHSQHGTEDEPHFYLHVSHENKYSNTINTGFVHGTLKLGLETDGPTEIGGLVLAPEYRNHPDKLGKQISFIRFLYMANHPQEFKEYVHSELMPPLDAHGQSPLWEAIGRRFMNMDYIEADLLSRSNKEFILSLFPSENIYMTLLPLEARNAIGKVGKETLPVKKMLESIGFKYINEVDPFDGGPHYRCRLSDITVIKNKFQGKVKPLDLSNNNRAKDYLIQIPNHKHLFYACLTKLLADENGDTFIDAEVFEKFKLNSEIEYTAIPFS